MSTSSRWFTELAGTAGKLKLFCIPCAGASASLFRDWRTSELLDVQLCAVELPGRGTRLSEPLLDRMDELVACLLMAIERELGDDFAFYGHSMGGSVAFELAHACRNHLGREPSCLLISSIGPPPRRQALLPTAVDDVALLRRLRFLGGLPPEVLEHAQAIRLALPRLRADFCLIDSYVCRHNQPLSCPIFTFAGQSDTICTSENMQQWRSETSGPFHHASVAGGHFFFQSMGHRFPKLLAAVARAAADPKASFEIKGMPCSGPTP